MKFVFLLVVVTLYHVDGHAEPVAVHEHTASREALLERYQQAFAPRAVFDETTLVALAQDTHSYLYTQAEQDVTLSRLHRKLLFYLHFFQINIKARGRQLSDWNYYRLMLDALRSVEHQHLTVTSIKSRRYYDLLHAAALAHLWRAARLYQENFPFLRWQLCQRFRASCPQHKENSDGLETVEQVVAVLNVAIDRLNSRIEHLNRVATVRFLAGNAAVYQRAVRDYLHTYEELLAAPYGALLLMMSKQQHRKMLTTPAPFTSYTLPKLELAEVKTVNNLFAKLAIMFEKRATHLDALYDLGDKSKLLHFLIRYHRQAVAEFLINYPKFFNIINYYLDQVNMQYDTIKQRLSATRRNNSFLAVGAAGLAYAALHHFLHFSRGRTLYFTALTSGALATTYSALQQKSLVDVFSLQQQVEMMHNSLVMQQSHDFLHLLHQLGRLAKVRSDALLQGGMLTVYTLFFVRHARKAWRSRQLQHLHDKVSPSLLTTGVDVQYQDFSLQKIGTAINNYPDLRQLHITQRLQLIADLFGNYPPFRAWQAEVGAVKSMDDLDDNQIRELWNISRNLQRIFEPSDSNVEKIIAHTSAEYSASSVAADLDKVGFFIHRLFKIDLHGPSIPPVP